MPDWFRYEISVLFLALTVEEEPSQPTPVTSAATAAPVRSKWELVDYGDDSDDKEDENE